MMCEGQDSNLSLEFEEHDRVRESSQDQLPGGYLVLDARHPAATVWVLLDEFNRGSDRGEELDTQAPAALFVPASRFK